MGKMALYSTTCRIALCVFALCACSWLALGSAFQYPQCRNKLPPFRVHEQLTFCERYAEYGCCKPHETRWVKNRYDKTVSNFTRKQLADCGAQIENMLCETCSSYTKAIHKTGWPLPRLCDEFCASFYNKCGDVLHLVSPSNVMYVESLTSVDAFCRADTALMQHSEYCYPRMLHNIALNNELKRFASMTDGCLCLHEFASGLTNPVLMRAPADNFIQAYVAEQSGVIHIYYTDDDIINRKPTTFMDLSHVVPKESGERRFLGFAFHPKFTRNGKFYVYFSIKKRDKEKTRISEFNAVNNRANVSSERIILQIEQPYATHKRGEILFGIDGFLYVFVDGVNANAQNKSILLGKILRIDIDAKSGELPYTIPEDNPFVDEKGARAEIYAYGIRSMWRADVDEGDETGVDRGRIIGADQGEDSVVEIDIIQRGGNYGWNAREGFDCYDKNTCGKTEPEVKPIYAYTHNGPTTVIGGHMYRGCRNPSLHGQYIYAESVTGKLFSLQELGNGTWKNRQVELCAEDVCSRGDWVSKHGLTIMSFGEDADGEIYVLTSNNAGQANGMIHKLVDPRRSGDEYLCRSTRGMKIVMSDATKMAVSAPVIYVLSIALQTVTNFL